MDFAGKGFGFRARMKDLNSDKIKSDREQNQTPEAGIEFRA